MKRSEMLPKPLPRLLCVAPDGDLEIWWGEGHNWDMERSWSEFVHPFVGQIHVWHGGPEFWGREVLGEL